MTQTNGIPPIILDNYDQASPEPLETPLDETNVDVAVSKLIHEMGQPGYNAIAALKNISTEHLWTIVDAINDVIDDDEDVTFEAVREVLAEDGLDITTQQYLDATRLNFS